MIFFPFCKLWSSATHVIFSFNGRVVVLVALFTESVSLRLGERLFSKLSSSVLSLEERYTRVFNGILHGKETREEGLCLLWSLGLTELIPSPLLVCPALSYCLLLTSPCLNNLPKKWKVLVWGPLLLILLHLQFPCFAQSLPILHCPNPRLSHFPQKNSPFCSKLWCPP